MTLATSNPTTRLLDILSYRRPGGSDTERAFINRFIKPLNPYQDGYGNFWHEVLDGDQVSPIMWSSHTDTVHRRAGRQEAYVDPKGIIRLRNGKVGECLGADCGTGVWLMLEMIAAKVPGLYLFHRDEETGGGGSQWIAANEFKNLAHIKFAIALDRKGDDSVITHQMGRCCSDRFADQLSSLLGGKFDRDPTGVFTDTANYTDIIPECTNLSVGYYMQHGPAEHQDLAFALDLREKLTTIDFSPLEAHRDPKEVDDIWWDTPGPAAVTTKKGFKSKFDDPWSDGYDWGRSEVRRERCIEDFILDHAEFVAELLQDEGYDLDSLEELEAAYDGGRINFFINDNRKRG